MSKNVFHTVELLNTAINSFVSCQNFLFFAGLRLDLQSLVCLANLHRIKPFLPVDERQRFVEDYQQKHFGGV